MHDVYMVHDAIVYGVKNVLGVYGLYNSCLMHKGLICVYRVRCV